MSTIRTFLTDEAGAVTVDWVVLTAAVVGLGLAVISTVRQGTNAMATEISETLSSASVVSLGCLGARATGSCAPPIIIED